MLFAKKATSDVFGVSNEILPDSYVDRGQLDERIQLLLKRPTHIALRGESKCGKSWLRQRNIPNAIVVQCRLKKTVVDLYVDALSQLQINFTVEQTQSSSLKGSVEASGEIGASILAKLGFKVTSSGETGIGEKATKVGRDINDLRYIAEIIKASGKRLVVEDFHYMSVEQRKGFAFDLKALWDYGVFVVVIGVWSQSNMLIYLNPDLTGRIEELSIYWIESDLDLILMRGGSALQLAFERDVKNRMITDCFGNAGILQRLALGTLDELGITEEQPQLVPVEQVTAVEGAEMAYAEQLNPLYQQFAKLVSSGIRTRENSTGIYAHAMAVIMAADDTELMRGLPLDAIFERAHARQDRIQRGNLAKVLEKFEELQVDDDGRGLVLSYNDATGEVSIVDRQLLLYRRYATVKWPWEDMIIEADKLGKGFDY
ncbi:hypothetical protein [Bradyrhizobium elkanii]|uniref:hypothetical protein n=1 Tax=Bradyrhizobium elkanii TaxID=29448 RepID=UPI002169786D|nr:hypothetical protein [Bradyrhizobium elkanii]MCS3689086.1 hypothetical protein [Bradyrhizobium elkanii]